METVKVNMISEVMLLVCGKPCHDQGKYEKLGFIFSRVGKSQEILFQVLEFINHCSKSVRSQGNF